MYEFCFPKMPPSPTTQLPAWQLLMMVLIPLPMVSARPGPMAPSSRMPTLSESPMGRLAVNPRVPPVERAVPITSADEPLMPE